MQRARPIALFCSDIHLSQEAPVARSNEPNWFKAQKRCLDDLRQLSTKHKVPIICAGDVFHRWNSPPSLVNFALENLPEMYAVPGQHDLPNHQYDRMDESIFGVMVKVGRIKLIPPEGFVDLPEQNLRLFGFPWGFELAPCAHRKEGWQNWAVVHHFVWSKGAGYPGAQDDDNVKSFMKKMSGYDGIVAGDNHKMFLYQVTK